MPDLGENNIYSGQERRRRIRTKIEAALRFLVFDTPNAGSLVADDVLKVFSGIINNISEEGVCLRTNDLEDKWHSNLLNGKIVLSMKFKLDNYAKSISTIGRVRWIKIGTTRSFRHALGVEFIELGANERKNINNFITTRIEKR